MHTAESKISSKRRLNILDYGLVVVTLLSAAGFGLAKAGHAGVNQVIKGTHKVNIEVFITGLKTKDINLFKVGDKSSITIRNQPVQPPMTIVKVDHQQKQVAFLSPDGKKAMAFPDPANSIAHDFYVTVQDEADATDDGYVIRGNKINVAIESSLRPSNIECKGLL